MKLFSIKTLTTAIMLSSAVLLSSCSNMNKKTIIDILDGYWISDCDKGKNSSAISYFKAEKLDNNKLKFGGKIKIFTTNNCTGDFTIKNDVNFTKTFTKEEMMVMEYPDFKVIDDNHWKNTEHNINFTRISEDEYNKVK